MPDPAVSDAAHITRRPEGETAYASGPIADELTAAITEALEALNEARRFIRVECPHGPTELELRRVSSRLRQAWGRWVDG